MLTRVERAADRSRCRLARFGVESNSKNRARSSEITGDQPMIPDAPSDSFSRNIAHMTSPERRRWPQTAKVDGNGARARIPFGHPPARHAREAAKTGLCAGITSRADVQTALMSVLDYLMVVGTSAARWRDRLVPRGPRLVVIWGPC